MTLNSRAMVIREERDKALQLEHDMETAAIRIESAVRRKVEMRKVNIVRTQADLVKRNHAALVIEAHLRGLCDRKVYKKMVEEEQHRAITVIQARIRAQKGRVRTQELKVKKERQKRMHDAASVVQCIYRGKLARRKWATSAENERWIERQQNMYEKTEDIEGLRNLKLEQSRRLSVVSLGANSALMGALPTMKGGEGAEEDKGEAKGEAKGSKGHEPIARRRSQSDCT